MRTTSTELYRYVNMVNFKLNLCPPFMYSLSHMPSGYRLEQKNGSVDVSQRLSAQEMKQYLLGMLESIDRLERNNVDLTAFVLHA